MLSGSFVELAPHSDYLGRGVGIAHPLVEGTRQLDPGVGLDDRLDLAENVAVDQKALNLPLNRRKPTVPFGESGVGGHGGSIPEGVATDHKIRGADMPTVLLDSRLAVPRREGRCLALPKPIPLRLFAAFVDGLR